MTLRDIVHFLAGIFRLVRSIPRIVGLSSRVALWNSDEALAGDPDQACLSTPGYEQELEKINRYIIGT